VNSQTEWLIPRWIPRGTATQVGCHMKMDSIVTQDIANRVAKDLPESWLESHKPESEANR
jgi:hypothetical protein